MKSTDKGRQATPWHFRVAHALLHSAYAVAVLGITKLFYIPRHGNWVDITNLNIYLPRLPTAFDSYRMVQISDFHIGTWLDRALLAEAVDLVNQQNPDLVAITGDFVTYDPPRFSKDLVGELTRLQTRDGVVAVLGNHDHWSNAAAVRKILGQSRVIELRNNIYTLEKDGARLHIAGVDDIQSNLHRLDLVVDKLPPNEAAILLAHQPDFADEFAATGCFDLQISGHSHGGQLNFPGVGPIVLPRLGRKYISGLYKVQNMWQYTNRGLGTAELQVRYNCRPEITVFNLVSHQSSGNVSVDGLP